MIAFSEKILLVANLSKIFGFGAGIYVAVSTTFIFVYLFNVQVQLEDPFSPGGKTYIRYLSDHFR